MKYNAIAWFEIPVTDMERAIKFYTTVFGFKLQRAPMGELDMAFFPWEQDATGASGALIFHKEWYKPSATDGVLVYFAPPSGDLANELSKVEAAGGKVVQPKTLIREDVGYMAVFLDTEGNRVAMYSK
jgi:uncharacterized protein